MSARLAVAATIAFAAVATFAFGTLLSETLLLYPNIFADVPDSLALTTEFMAVSAPGDVLPPLGAASLLTGIAAVALTARQAAVRWWEIAAVVSLLFGQFLFSAIFFWPRNRIMFTEGAAMHDAAYLQQIAAEFQAGHWVRVAAGALAATLAFVAMLRMHRRAITVSGEQSRADTPT